MQVVARSLFSSSVIMGAISSIAVLFKIYYNGQLIKLQEIQNLKISRLIMIRGFAIPNQRVGTILRYN